MPELPEVETTLRFIRPRVINQRVTNVIIRQPSLRYRIPADLSLIIVDNKVKSLVRRAKYLVFNFDKGNLLIHLGMSGNLRITNISSKLQKHDHFDIIFGATVMRYNDPRRFGCIVWEEDGVKDRVRGSLLDKLGIEPLSNKFTAEKLFGLMQGKNTPIKQFIMDARFVVGIGNIYASEILWRSRISPLRSTKECLKDECQVLCSSIKEVLNKAIKSGGSTIKDFYGADGKPGYFALQLNVYGKEGKKCPTCSYKIKRVMQGQRATFYCDNCQL